MLTTGILICCTCHFQRGSLCVFGFFCLQVSSVSNFHPDTRGQRWILVWAHLFSRAVGKEEHCKQIALVCAGSACSFSATLVCPRSQGVFFPNLHCSGFRLLCRERALDCVHFSGLSRSGSGSQVLHSGADSVGPAFCAIPWLKQLRRPGASGDQVRGEHTLLRRSASYQLPRPSRLGFRECRSPVCHVSLLGS